MDTIKLLRQLTETPGPSGDEGRVAARVSKLWQPYVDELKVDRVGNVMGIKNGRGHAPRRRLMLAAHMDEIGLMVKQITRQGEHGFLRLTKVGGVDVRQLYGQIAVVHGKQDLVGVIGALPGRMLPKDRADKPFGFEDLVLDIGRPWEEVQAQVSVGDFVSFRQPLRKLSGRLVTGKALDNRASVAAVTKCLEILQGRHHEWDVLAVATAQEETRLLGAFTSAYAQQPDAAVAVDVTFAKGAGSGSGEIFELGGGPAIDIGPNVHPGMHKALREAAEAIEMKVATSTHARASGTDTFALQIARAGIPTGLVGIPLRYMHTMVEMIHADDVERAGRLLSEFTARLDDHFLDGLAKGLMDGDA